MTARQTLLAVILLAMPFPLFAQNRKPITSEGTEGFRAMLVGKGLQPLGSLAELRAAVNADPAKVLIVTFHGLNAETEPLPDPLAVFNFDLRKDFVERGGALFVATDIPVNDTFNDAFGASVEKTIVYASYRARRFGGSGTCPYIARKKGAYPNLFERSRDLSGAALPNARSNTDLQDVATNRPSFLGPSNELETLAIFPARTWSTHTLGGNDLDLAFAQGKRYPGGGKLLLMADHSVFINSMLLPQSYSNDNLPFTSNCIDWLMLGPDVGKRAYVMFVEDGHIWQREDYNLMLQSLPPPRTEDIADLLWENRDLLWQNRDLAEALLGQMDEEGVFAELERSDPFGSLVSDLFSDWAIVRFVLILATAALLGYGLWSLMGSKNRFPRKVPRLALLLDRMRPRAGLLDLRLRSGLGSGQYYELARQRARQTFAELNLQPAVDGPPPRFTVEGDWWQRGRIARELREVWAVAYGSEPVPVRAKQWAKWQQRLARLATLVRGGTIHFE